MEKDKTADVINEKEKIDFNDLANLWEELPEETRERLYYMVLGVKFANDTASADKTA